MSDYMPWYNHSDGHGFLTAILDLFRIIFFFNISYKAGLIEIDLQFPVMLQLCLDLCSFLKLLSI